MKTGSPGKLSCFVPNLVIHFGLVEETVVAIMEGAVTKTRLLNLSIAKEVVESPRYTGDMVVERFEGKRIGRKSLAAICQELNLDCAKVKQKLNAKQLEIKDDESLKDAATRRGVVPIDLFKIISVGEPIKLWRCL